MSCVQPRVLRLHARALSSISSTPLEASPPQIRSATVPCCVTPATTGASRLRSCSRQQPSASDPATTVSVEEARQRVRMQLRMQWTRRLGRSTYGSARGRRGRGCAVAGAPLPFSSRTPVPPRSVALSAMMGCPEQRESPHRALVSDAIEQRSSDEQPWRLALAASPLVVTRESGARLKPLLALACTRRGRARFTLRVQQTWRARLQKARLGAPPPSGLVASTPSARHPGPGVKACSKATTAAARARRNRNPPHDERGRAAARPQRPRSSPRGASLRGA